MITNYSSNLAKQFSSLFIASVFISTIMMSCDSGDYPENIEDTDEPAGKTEEVKSGKPEESVYYMLPSALQIAHIFKKSGLKYYPDVTNDPNNVNIYVSETSKLQNLGVYSADLCYVALNKQTQEELRYLKAMMDMSRDMGFSSVFSSGAFMDRFERNISNEDSMIVILAELQERLDYYLQDAEMEDKSTVIFSGAWIESIYISLAGYRVEGDKSGLTVRIHEQLYILASLISKLEAVWEPEEDIKVLTAELKELQGIIENFAFMENVNKKKHVSLEEVSLSEKELEELVKKVEAIRANVTKG